MADKKHVKISDFGLSRAVNNGGDYYKKVENGGNKEILNFCCDCFFKLLFIVLNRVENGQ